MDSTVATEYYSGHVESTEHLQTYIKGVPQYFYIQSTRYLDFVYLEKTLISKWKSSPCSNMKVLHQVTKYCGKEEKLKEQFLIFSAFFQYISNFRSQIAYSFVKCGCSIYFSSVLQKWSVEVRISCSIS